MKRKLANTPSSSCAQQKKKTKKANLISKGKRVDQMDVGRRKRAWPIHLKEEIIMEILSRLPVQSLLRFKCVSKFWEALIADPYFKMKHLNQARDFPKLIITKTSKDGLFSVHCCPLSSLPLVEDVQKLDCPFYPKPTSFKILCCCDGFFVIKVRDNFNLLLWNPSTREFLVLPAQEFPVGNCSCFGMGYDSTSGDYKILHMRRDLRRSLPSEILALKGGSWRRIDKNPRGFISLLFAMQFLTFVHAAFHWVGLSRERYFVVVSFSISNEVYGEIPLPEEMLSLRGHINFGISVLEGTLCIHYTSLHREGKCTFKLWALKEYAVKESWVPLFAIEDPSISMALPKYRFANGELLVLCMFVGSHGWAFRTPSGPFVSWPQLETFQDGYAFTESLISPKSLTY